MKHTNRELPTLSKLGQVLDHSRVVFWPLAGSTYEPTHWDMSATEPSLQLRRQGAGGVTCKQPWAGGDSESAAGWLNA